VLYLLSAPKLVWPSHNEPWKMSQDYAATEVFNVLYKFVDIMAVCIQRDLSNLTWRVQRLY